MRKWSEQAARHLPGNYRLLWVGAGISTTGPILLPKGLLAGHWLAGRPEPSGDSWRKLKNDELKATDSQASKLCLFTFQQFNVFLEVISFSLIAGNT